MMKKSTKLLSVILAIVMLFTSMSVMASAARASYQASADLESMDAYSPFGAVTRLSTEERLSILCDSLDDLLGGMDALNMGTVIDIPLVATLTINLTSIDAALDTVDNVKELLTKGLTGALVGMMGILGDLNLDNWDEGMSRDGTAHTHIVSELLNVLSVNAGVIANVLRTGTLDLGVIGNFVDLSEVEQYLGDIPGLIKSLITPLFERKDDTVEWAKTLAAASSMDSILTSFVQGLFTKPQSTTTVKADSTGALQSNHDLPTAEDGLRYYYVAGNETNGTPNYTAYVYDTETDAYVAEDERFVLTEEVEGSGVYVFKKASGDTLKYYEPESYWLPSLVESGSAADIMNISTQTGVQMLYNMIPYVFGEMAPVVLNGSVKKAIGEWFGASYNYVGEVGSDEVNALGSDPIFTGEQGEYLWEWSDYAVIGGEHYYRFEDSVYQADLSNTNAYMDIVNWDYVIPDDLLNDYIPGADGNTPSNAGYNTILQGLNDFLGEVIDLVLAPNVVSAIGWVDGSNSNLLENVKKAARAVVTIAPETIFGEHYEDDEYYQLLIDESATDQEILCGIAAKLLEFLMPQLILPSASSLEGQSLGAMLAMVIRELATQLLPTYNYDDLIFTDYNTKTLRVADNDYWLDVCLTMGVDIGMNYLSNLVDLNDGNDPGYTPAASKTYAYDRFDPKDWEVTVDWVIDWALTNDYEWSWKMENLVDCGEAVDLATAQDPWVKLGNILKNLLPIDQILNVNTEDPNWLETTLRDNFVLSLLNLDVGNIVGDSDTTGLLDIPNDSVLFTQPLLTAAVGVVRDLLNDLLYKVAGNYTFFDTNTYTSLDSVLNQQNLANLVEALLQRLEVANNNGLLDTVMPFLGFFVGWTTDAQELANPDITITNQDGLDYMYTNSGTVTSTIDIQNMSTGMLLKHRSNGSYDQAYNMVIDGFTSTYGTVSTSTSLPITVAPGASTSFNISMPYTQDQAILLTMTYHYTFKDGTAVGGTQTMNVYQYVSNYNYHGNYSQTYDGSGVFVALRLSAWATTDLFVRRAEDFGTAVAGLNVSWQNRRDEWIDVEAATATSGSPDYIVSSGRQEAAFPNAQFTEETTTTVYPFLMNENANLDNLASGTILPIGNAYTRFHSSYAWVDDTQEFTCDFGNLYYADMGDLIDLYDAEVSAARLESLYGASEWAAYVQAMLDVADMIYAPPQDSNFSTKYAASNIEAVTENLQDAVTALEASATGAPVDVVENALEAAEGEDGINFQNYAFYEYWDYEEVRNTAWDIIAAYETPEAPDKYIAGNALSEAEINAIIAAEGNTTLQDAITSTMLDPSEADIEAYQEALAAYVAPAYTNLTLADTAAKLGYYKQFLMPKMTTKQFLAKELAYAAAQNYVETAWSTDSWNAYQAALTAATEVNSDGSALQSEVFDAKYNLMLAQNNLVPADESAKDNGVYDSLNSLIATADSIFADTEGAWTVKEGVEPADAYKQLVEALGYEYEDADGYTQNLYWDSAKAFVATDRIIGDATTSATNAMSDKLEAAIANFESAVTEPNTLVIKDTAMYEPVIDLTNKSAEYTGSIYGIDTLGWNDNLMPDGMLADFLTTSLGDEYLRITTPDSGVETTGTIIEVLDADMETVLETYVFVYFGDVDMDGLVGASDADIVSYYEANYMGIDTLAQFMAGDLDGDAWPTAADGDTMSYYEANYMGMPMQSDVAAMASFNIYELI